jgi:histidyl-tRNA synthetase
MPEPTDSPSAPPPAPRPARGSHALQAPTGTRDFYPAELARLRYIQKAWRDTSIAHGFDEIDGPTFEHLDLYTIKSGEGIVSELFSFERFGGEKTFALRPEFTPTLARMYASKAASLPKPTKWFWQQNCYRAERPQRGRLREFCQWNCDIIGTDSPTNEPEAQARMDAEIIATCVGMLERLGLGPGDVKVRLNDRRVLSVVLGELGFDVSIHGTVCDLIDRRSKLSAVEFARAAGEGGLNREQLNAINELVSVVAAHGFDRVCQEMFPADSEHYSVGQAFQYLGNLLDAYGLRDWWSFDPTIVRGLAYYTGMVFEVHEASGAERAIAGGGRYDGLIELFGGPPTPAVGFGMGDVVLSLVLQDKKKFPTDDKIADDLGLTPDALVISNGTPDADAMVAPTLANLRRTGLHARRSYKTTKNVGKLIQDAAKLRARYCVIIESATTAQVKDMQTQAQQTIELSQIVAAVRPLSRTADE